MLFGDDTSPLALIWLEFFGIGLWKDDLIRFHKISHVEIEMPDLTRSFNPCPGLKLGLGVFVTTGTKSLSNSGLEASTSGHRANNIDQLRVYILSDFKDM